MLFSRGTNCTCFVSMFGGHFDEENDSFLKFKSVVKQLDKLFN